MDWPTLIETLKAIMQRDGLNVQNVAQELNISSSSVRNYLSLRQRASISKREQIEAYVAAKSQPASDKQADKPRQTKKQDSKKQDSKKSATKRTDKKADQQEKTTAKKQTKRGASVKQAQADDKSAADAQQTQQRGRHTKAAIADEKVESKQPRRGRNTQRQTQGNKNDQQKQAQPVTLGLDNQPEAKQAPAKKQAATSAAPQQQAPATKPVVTETTTATEKADVKATTQPATTQTPASTNEAAHVQQEAAATKATETAAQPAPQQAAPAQAQADVAANVAVNRSATPARREPTPVRIYVDESFGRVPEKPFTIGMVLASTALGVMPFKEFTETLYPFGWAPGDEVKAAGKDLANVKNILTGSQNDDIRMFAFRTTTTPTLITVTDDDSTTLAIFPYVSAIINAIETMQHGGLEATEFQIVIDRTNKLPAEAQRVMEKLLGVYFRLSGNKPCTFHITDGDSRAQKGLQLADFVAHYAYVEDADKISKFAPVTGVLDDPIGNARRFAFYSGLRLLKLKPEAETIYAEAATVTPEPDVVAESPAETAAAEKPIARAMTLACALKETIIGAQEMGFGGKQLEAVRSRLKGLSTTIGNWLLDSQMPLIEGMANRTISDFRERTVVVTRVDKPFRPDHEIGEQQFRIFESQLERVRDLIDSYKTTAEA